MNSCQASSTAAEGIAKKVLPLPERRIANQSRRPCITRARSVALSSGRAAASFASTPDGKP